jgi:hypothetical protein
MNKFLILGTGADINDIDFSRISDKFITGGVNYIHKKIIPDYYFAYDLKDHMIDIPDEIKVVYTHPAKLAEYFRDRISYKQNYCTYYDETFTPTAVMDGKEYDCNHGSVNYLIRMLNNYLYKNQCNIFYIAGVPLLKSVGHFFNDHGDTTSIQRVLDKFYNDFMRLKRLDYNIISLMKVSKINDLFPQEDIELIYDKGGVHAPCL